MLQIAEPDRLGTLRETMRQSLDAITNDSGMAMRDAGLTLPVFITVLTSGDTLATIAAPLDPSDWEHVRVIVNGIIERRIGCGKLRARELTCAAANMAPITAADVVAE